MMFNKKTLVVAAILGVVVACSTSEQANSVKPNGQQDSESPSAAVGDAAKQGIKPEKDRHVAPPFALKDLDGKTAQLADYKGKVVLLNFWATWCAPCKLEIPWFEEFQTRYKDKGFEVLGVSLDEEGWKVVKPYLERTKVNYRMVMGDVMIDKAYGPIEALPTSFLIDREGRVAAVHSSLVDKDETEGEIRELLRVSSGARVSDGVTELASAQH